ncbi:MAG: OmpA family protein [Magnetococcales bacterium]|nr:OmpA family protein [Magnetococcales bacterium]
MKLCLRPSIAILLLGLLAGCAAAPERVILVADDDGTVGRAVVSTSAGSVVLDEGREGTRIIRAKTPPETPTTMADTEITGLFARAIAAKSRTPVRFVLHFLTGGTELTDDSKNRLPEVLNTLRGWPVPQVAVTGHTDRVGSADINYRLSLERASLVRDKLIAIGVTPSAIEVTSHGESNPIVPTADDVSEPRNRRVEVAIR